MSHIYFKKNYVSPYPYLYRVWYCICVRATLALTPYILVQYVFLLTYWIIYMLVFIKSFILVNYIRIQFVEDKYLLIFFKAIPSPKSPPLRGCGFDPRDLQNIGVCEFRLKFLSYFKKKKKKKRAILPNRFVTLNGNHTCTPHLTLNSFNKPRQRIEFCNSMTFNLLYMENPLFPLL